jgi:hypothetical protein
MLLQKQASDRSNEIHLKNKVSWISTRKSDNSIITDRSGVTPHKQDAAQQRDSPQKQGLTNLNSNS